MKYKINSMKHNEDSKRLIQRFLIKKKKLLILMKKLKKAKINTTSSRNKQESEIQNKNDGIEALKKQQESEVQNRR